MILVKTGFFFDEKNKKNKLEKEKPYPLNANKIVIIGNLKIYFKKVDHDNVPVLDDSLFSLKKEYQYLSQDTFYQYHLALKKFFMALDIDLSDVPQECLVAIIERCGLTLAESLAGIKGLLIQKKEHSYSYNDNKNFESKSNEFLTGEYDNKSFILNDFSRIKKNSASLPSAVKYSFNEIKSSYKRIYQDSAVMSNLIKGSLNPDLIEKNIFERIGFFDKKAGLIDSKCWNEYKVNYKKNFNFFNFEDKY